MDLKSHIRAVPDFPKPGILFYDISTLLENAVAWHTTIDRLAEAVRAHEPDLLVGIESRGFLLSAPLAYKLELGFTMARKKGKLPAATIAHSYELEYGVDTVEIHSDAVAPGQRVVVVDDLFATGGTMDATITLLRKMKADVRGAACIIELTFLDGRDRIDVPLTSLIAYDE